MSAASFQVSVIGWRVAVASAMCTRRAGAGSAEARNAGANGARIEAQRFESEGRSRSSDRGPQQGVWRLGGSEIHCHFIAPAPSCKHQALSAQCRCRSRYRAFSLIRTVYSSISQLL